VSVPSSFWWGRKYFRTFSLSQCPL
jgi:hypothetical protein